jgi:protein SCO1
MQKLVLTLVGIGALIAGFLVFNGLPQTAEPQPQALVYNPPRALAPFTLSGHDGELVSNQQLHGQWTLLFTGYTFCPDICPTTMADLRRIMPQLVSASEVPVKVWMISVDPLRDDVQRVKSYASFFGDEFYGVRAEHPQLYPFVTDLGLMYSIPDEGETDYLVNHSAAIVLVDPNGNRHAIFNAEHQLGELPTVNMDKLVSDFSIIAKRFRY